jgi:uncharacterized surface protein with fasciclin (FAS1) repeats
MSKDKTSMVTWKRPLGALLVAALLVSMLGLAVSAQTVQSQELAGVLTGGQSAQIWLGLNPQTPSEQVQVTATWDRVNPTNNGVGFYVLTADQTRSVLAGGSLGANNLATGARLSSASPDNEIGAVFGGTAGPYTIVLYNNSSTDASFTINVTNGVLIDDSGQVRDNLAPDADDEADEADEAEVEEAEAPAAPAPVAVAPTTTTVTATVEAETTETEVTETEAVAEVESAEQATLAATGEVRSPIMQGELPNQFDQHILTLEPEGRDISMRILLAFDPQDQQELARRMNFWVMNQAGFRRYADPSSNTPPGSIAFAAGSSSNTLRENERAAEFTIAGDGSVIVIVYNNSEIPATYTIQAERGIFMDDSQQTLTAQRAAGTITTTVTVDGEATEAITTTTTTTAPATTTTTTAATTTRTGTPGGTYVVQAGDTLSLIARDVLSNMGAWRDICNINELADCNRIEIGQQLQLPTIEQIGTTQAATPAATTTTTTQTAPAATTATTPTTTTAMIPATTEADADEDEVDVADDAAEEDEAADDDAAASASGNLIDALRAAGSFDTLVTALEAAGLDDDLEMAGPFTVFAPTDAAFAALPAGAMEQLLNQPTGQLTQILLFHLLPGRVGSADVSDGMQATTQQGRAVRFEVDGSSVLVNGATLVAPDISASNGVIHAIDAVILPPTD